MNKKNLIIQILAIFLFLGSSSLAAELLVPSQYATIQSAVNAASNGDTVIVSPGTYQENVNIAGKSITLTGTDPNDWDVVGATIINANQASYGITIPNSSTVNVKIKGLMVRNASSSGIRTDGSGTNAEISRCIIKENNSGMYLLSKALVSSNKIFSNTSHGIEIGGPGSEIKSNFIYGNGRGMYLQDYGIPAPFIRSNTIVANTNGGIQVSEDDDPVAISNCIVRGTNPLDNCGATYSCIQGGAGGTGNIGSDPCFADAANSDYHLTINSPCIDAGNPNGDYSGEVDIDGNERIISGQVDMGADEVSFSSLPIVPDLTGIDEGDAIDTIEAIECVSYGTSSTELSATIPAGGVIRQSAVGEVYPNTVVDLTVSSGSFNAVLKAVPSVVKLGDAVVLDASGSYDEDAYIQKYKWDFGDGSDVYEQTPGWTEEDSPDEIFDGKAVHIYKQESVIYNPYTVTLTVTNSLNETAVTTCRVEVYPYTLDVSRAGDGTVTRTNYFIDPDRKIYATGETVKLEAKPALGWSFDEWSGDVSEWESDENPLYYSFYEDPYNPKPKDRMVEANFVNNLISWYKMDDDAPNNVVLDSSGNGYNGTSSLYNTSDMNIVGKIDGALWISGLTDCTDCINTGNSFESVFQDSFTVNLWVKSGVNCSNSYSASFLGTLCPGGSRFCFGVDDSLDLSVRYGNSDCLNCPVPEISGFYLVTQDQCLIEEDAWHMATAVIKKISGTTLNCRIYVDGVEKANQSYNVAMSYYDLPYPLYIGAHNTGYSGNPSYCFGGGLDNIMIFNKALDPNEILNLYSQTLQISTSDSNIGTVIEPGIGSHAYPYSQEIAITAQTVAPADPHYRFVGWSGEVVEAGAVADLLSASTTVNMAESVLMNNNCTYTLTANFAYIYYVNAAATGDNDGSSWTDAFKFLQDALDVAKAGDQIWVAGGTYKPDCNSAYPTGNGGRDDAFRLIDDVEIYGGFPPGGGNWESRNPNMYETKLNGDIGTSNRYDNSYHVVTADSNVTSSAVLDGFTITEGYANDSNLADRTCNKGAGMYNSGGSPTIVNCTFTRNWTNSTPPYQVATSVFGGGMFNEYGSPTITDCNFYLNWVGNYNQTGYVDGFGGGICNSYSSPTITDCNFNSNSSGSDEIGDAGAGGGMFNIGGSLTLTGCNFIGNNVGDLSDGRAFGGGMYNGNCNSISIIDCHFIRNSAAGAVGGESGGTSIGHGGGIYDSNCNLTITDCIFGPGNHYDAIVNTNCTLEIEGCDFIGNKNGISNSNSAGTITGCIFSGNNAYSLGAGMYNTSSTLDIENCIFRRNFSTCSGGGMYNSYDNSTIRNCIFSENVAGYNDKTNRYGSGGGMANYLSDQTIENCIFSGNSAFDDDGGGGLYNYKSAPIITNCTFSGNWTGGDGSGTYYYGAGNGGGIYNNDSDPTIKNCTFSVNKAEKGDGGYGGNGGGIYSWNYSKPTIANCVFSKNEAEDNGGGMYNQSGSSHKEIFNCTFGQNEATYGKGGGIYNYNISNIFITNCILWGNTAASDPQIYEYLYSSTVTFSDVQGGWSGTGNKNEVPDFENTPEFTGYTTGNAADLYTIVVADASLYKIGDIIEYQNDGVGRAVTWVDETTDVVTFTPPLSSASITNDAVSNWGTDAVNSHLESTSPCIDEGSEGLNYDGQTDIDGDERVIDIPGEGNGIKDVDMGADEYKPNP